MSQLRVVNNLVDPGNSDFRLHRPWFVDSAMDELLETDFAVAAKDRLYRCLDRVLSHKQELIVWLKQKWASLFHSDIEVLLYDLTSTYFEGEMVHNTMPPSEGRQPRPRAFVHCRHKPEGRTSRSSKVGAVMSFRNA